MIVIRSQAPVTLAHRQRYEGPLQTWNRC